MESRHAIPINRADEVLRQALRVFLVLKSIGLICAICFVSAAFAQVRYQVTRIPTAQGANSVALGINNKGEVSRAGEFHPDALPELDVNLSAHPAPVIQSLP